MKNTNQLKWDLDSQRLAATVKTIRRVSKSRYIINEYQRTEDPTLIDCRRIKSGDFLTASNKYCARAALCAFFIRGGAGTVGNV